MVGDILDPDGKVVTIDVLRQHFKLSINLLNYYTVRAKASVFVKKYRSREDTNFLQVRPAIPFHSSILFGSKYKSNFFYTNLINFEHQQETPAHETKWEAQLGHIIQENWYTYYRVCFQSIKDNSFIWLQCRILHRILGTNSYLYKIKIANTNLCRLCGNENESILHLFVECPKVKELWKNIATWFEYKLSITVELDTATKILGYHIRDEHFWPLNFVLIIAKHYVFYCARNNENLNIFRLQQIIKSKFEEQEALARLNCEDQLFSKKWSSWICLFNNL